MPAGVGDWVAGIMEERLEDKAFVIYWRLTQKGQGDHNRLQLQRWRWEERVWISWTVGDVWVCFHPTCCSGRNNSWDSRDCRSSLVFDRVPTGGREDREGQVVGFIEDCSWCSVSVLGTRLGERRNRERRRLVGSLSCFLAGMVCSFTKHTCWSWWSGYRDN